jgi:hypothetical protein
MPNGIEELKKSIYSTKNLPVTSTEEMIGYEYYSYLPVKPETIELQFFGYTIGQLVPGTDIRATKKHTNMSQPNQIPAPYRFLLKEITCDIIPDVETISNGNFISDYYKIVNEGYFEFVIGSKVYQDGRLIKLAPKVKLLGFAGNVAKELVNMSGETYKIKPEGILLPSGLVFNFVVKFDSAVNISTQAGMVITFWGVLVRPTQ